MTTKTPALTFGQRLRAIRQSKFLTLEAVAQGAGMSLGYIWGIEHDKWDCKLSTLHRLAKALDCTAAQLVGAPIKLGKHIEKEETDDKAPQAAQDGSEDEKGSDDATGTPTVAGAKPSTADLILESILNSEVHSVFNPPGKRKGSAKAKAGKVVAIVQPDAPPPEPAIPSAIPEKIVEEEKSPPPSEVPLNKRWPFV